MFYKKDTLVCGFCQLDATRWKLRTVGSEKRYAVGAELLENILDGDFK